LREQRQKVKMTESKGLDVLEQCMETCRSQPGTLVFPDTLDHRVLEAASQLKKEGLAEPVLVASPFAVRDKMRQNGLRAAGFTVVDHESPSLFAKNMESYMALRKEKNKPVSEPEARKTMANPLAASAMMVRRGDVEIGVAGNLSSTAEVHSGRTQHFAQKGRYQYHLQFSFHDLTRW
jgi:phosphotransacetylase